MINQYIIEETMRAQKAELDRVTREAWKRVK